MTILHIIALGPVASGKSTIVRHLAHNPPPGYTCTFEHADIPVTRQTEYWVLEFKKKKVRTPHATNS